MWIKHHFCCLLCIFKMLYCEKILLFVPTLSYSHVAFSGKMADYFVSMGYDVTILLVQIDPNVRNNGSKLAKVIKVNVGLDDGRLPKTLWQNPGPYEDANPTNPSILYKLIHMSQLFNEVCKAILRNKVLMSRLHAENFDVGVSEQYVTCGFAVFRLIGVKFTFWLSATAFYRPQPESMGIEYPLSYVPVDSGIFCRRADKPIIFFVKNGEISWCSTCLSWASWNSEPNHNAEWIQASPNVVPTFMKLKRKRAEANDPIQQNELIGANLNFAQNTWPYTYEIKLFSSFSSKMSIIERVKNVIIAKTTQFLSRFLLMRVESALARQTCFVTQNHQGQFVQINGVTLFSEQRDLLAKASESQAIFTNIMPILDFAAPTSNFIRSVTGITIDMDRETKRKSVIGLSRAWSTAIGSTRRFVIVTFGSIARTCEMPLQMRSSLFYAFQQFHEINFIIKFERSFDAKIDADLFGDEYFKQYFSTQNDSFNEIGASSYETEEMKEPIKLSHNVFAARWMPQIELISHSLCLGMITHGGWSSVLEAVFYAKPLVLMPLFADHFKNAKVIEEKGLAVLIDKQNIQLDTFANALRKIAYNPRYFAQSKKYARMMNHIAIEFSPPHMLIRHEMRRIGTLSKCKKKVINSGKYKFETNNFTIHINETKNMHLFQKNRTICRTNNENSLKKVPDYIIPCNREKMNYAKIWQSRQVPKFATLNFLISNSLDIFSPLILPTIIIQLK